MPGTYAIGAYYCPLYHVDPRNEAAHGAGWTEWELVKRGEPRFPGHQQPKVPLWGYEDESDPAVFARKIDAAADHGIDYFIFDWYYYDDGPFLERCLERGYLQAPNNSRLKFALMWANHDWVNIHPAKLHIPPVLQYPGAVTRATFDQVTDYVIERYFKLPSYWLIEGCPYFSIYELYRLIQGLGGIEATAEALQRFRERTRRAGFPDVHLNAVVWGIQILPNERAITNPADIVALLGLNSICSYVWIHHIRLPDFPVTDYNWVLNQSVAYWHATSGAYSVPYFPNVTMGWDASPRAVQSDRYLDVGYPFMPTLSGNSVTAFKTALLRVKTFLDTREGQPKIFNINAWNEWTEGSYLEPDIIHGTGYLEAIRDIFKGRPT